MCDAAVSISIAPLLFSQCTHKTTAPHTAGDKHKGRLEQAQRATHRANAPRHRTERERNAPSATHRGNVPSQRPEAHRGNELYIIPAAVRCWFLFTSRASALLCSRCRASLLALPRFFAHIAASSSPPGDKKNIKRVLCPTEYSTTIGFLMTVPSAGYSCGANLRVTLSADTRLMNMAR